MQCVIAVSVLCAVPFIIALVILVLLYSTAIAAWVLSRRIARLTIVNIAMVTEEPEEKEEQPRPRRLWFRRPLRV